MKKLTINEIVTINDVLTKIADLGLTGKAAYTAYRNLSRTGKVADDYEKVRIGLIEKYGEEDPEVEGQLIVKRDSDNYQKFVEELTEVLSGTEEIDLYQMPEEALDKLADSEDLNISDFAVIDNYLVDHPVEETEEAKADEEV